MTTPRPGRRVALHSRGDRLALALLALALTAGAVLSITLVGAGAADAVDLEVVEAAPQASEATQTPVDPDLEVRIAQDVAAYVNAERRAHRLPALDLLGDEHARADNEARLRDRSPQEDLERRYGAGVTAHELHVRLGTGTRSGEAVAGWLASGGDRALLLHRGASGIAVAAACQPGERGGDLVLTVHVVRAADDGPAAPAPIATDRPGAGRGEACQFAELATGPTPGDDVVAPAALALAGTVALTLALLEWQRRRHRAALARAERPDLDAG